MAKEAEPAGAPPRPSFAARVRSLIAALVNEPAIEISHLRMSAGCESSIPSELAAKLPGEILSLYEAMCGVSFSWCFEDWDRCFADGVSCVGGDVRFEQAGSLEAIYGEPVGEARDVLESGGLARGGKLTRGMNLESYLVEDPSGEGLAVYVYSHDDCEGEIAPLTPQQFVELGVAMGFMYGWEDVWQRMYDTLQPEQDGIPQPGTLEWMTRIRLARTGFIDPTSLSLPPELLAKIMLLFEEDEKAKGLFEEADPIAGLQSFHKYKKIVDKVRLLVERYA